MPKKTDNNTPLNMRRSALYSALVYVLFAHSSNAQTHRTSEPQSQITTTKLSSGEDGAEQQDITEVVITGSRRNLMDAQFMKRDADTMIDAVSEEDIGLLSDRSPLDAMQRLPGIAIERFAAPNDPDHFSVEASSIVLRGLKQTRSEFNGRDSFSAYSDRGLSYKDIPPELLGGIQVFKNQTADMVEGGIGGTVNLMTRKPFDIGERLFAFSVDQSYGDLVEESSPTFSALYNDTFNTSVGQLGFLINYVTSELTGTSHGIQSDAYLQFFAANLVTENNPNPEGTRAEDFLGDEDNGKVYVPSASNLLMKQDTREREGITAALQFESTDGAVTALVEYIRSDSTLSWHEQALKYQGGFYTLARRATAPLDGTHFIFDQNGLFQSGILANKKGSWRTASSGRSRVPNTSDGFLQFGHPTQMDSRVNDTRSLVEDLSLNLQWKASDNLTLKGDIQYIDARAAVDDLSIHINTWALFDYDISGNTPHLNLIEPWNGVRDASRNNDDQEGGLADNIWDGLAEAPNKYLAYPGFTGDPQGDQNYFQDPNNYFWRSAMDHYERSEGESLALKIDADYQINRGILRQLKVGYRFAEREQVVRSTSWNWGAVAPEWSNGVTGWDFTTGENGEQSYEGAGAGWLTDITPQQEGYEDVSWSNFFGGGVASIPGDTTIHATEDFIRSVMGKHPSRTLYYSPIAEGNWEPYPSRSGLDQKYGMFRPDEINTTIESKNAFYVRLDFGGTGQANYSGNIGLRYLTLDRTANGVIDFPRIEPSNHYTQAGVPSTVSLPLSAEVVDEYFYNQITQGNYADYDEVRVDLANNWSRNPYNYLSDNVRNFSAVFPVYNEDGTATIESGSPIFTGYAEAQQVKETYSAILPSFNIKLDITDELVARVAFAKSIALPNMGDIRNRTEFEPIDAINIRGNDDIIVTTRNIQVENKPDVEMIDSVKLSKSSGDMNFVAAGGNPFLKPMESVQYDFSLEWYFSDVGQLSAALFHKNLSNYFVQGVNTRGFYRQDTATYQDVFVTSTINGGDAKLDGVELSYHQFFSGFFENFGVQATYTFIDATSVPNNERNVENERWFSSIYEDTGIRVSPSRLPLEGQSDHTVNFIGMYEDDHWSARIAYNWRSKYLLTTRDVISKAPQWYSAHGELDASVLYNITDHFTIGIQAENLTKERSEIVMILNDDLLTAGRSWFETDRRVALVLRAEF